MRFLSLFVVVIGLCGSFFFTYLALNGAFAFVTFVAEVFYETFVWDFPGRYFYASVFAPSDDLVLARRGAFWFELTRGFWILWLKELNLVQKLFFAYEGFGYAGRWATYTALSYLPVKAYFYYHFFPHQVLLTLEYLLIVSPQHSLWIHWQFFQGTLGHSLVSLYVSKLYGLWTAVAVPL